MRNLSRVGWLLILLCVSGLVQVYSASAADHIYYYHNDHLGTPLAMTDESGQVVWRADYAPFGAAAVTTAAVENNFRLPGQWFDEETGLHQNWHRDYAPGAGRYVEADPIGLAENAVMLYAYAHNTPIRYFDPEGLNPKPLPSSRTGCRDCKPHEEQECRAICGSKGMQSCKVSQAFRITHVKNGLAKWEWKDGPMSCSCNDRPDNCLQRVATKFRDAFVDFNDWMQQNTPKPDKGTWSPSGLPWWRPTPQPIIP